MDKDNVVDKCSHQDIENCITVLEKLVNNSKQHATLPEQQKIALMKAAGQLSRPNRDEIKKRNKEIKQAKRQMVVRDERDARAATGIRTARETAVFKAPKQIVKPANSSNPDIKHEDSELIPELKLKSALTSPRNCYICKTEFTRLHFFYDSMCMNCAESNYQKRFQTAPLHGQVALITGARLKIGYQASLMMLKAGANVIATTRFPVDAAIRFSNEEDFHEWGSRLQIYGLDLRHTPSVEIFCNYIEQNNNRLDILINNAAQTVRRPPGFYSHLMDNETGELGALSVKAQSLLGHYRACKEQLMSFDKSNVAAETSLPVTWHGNVPGIGLRASAQLSQIPYSHDNNSIATEEVFPKGKLDVDLQQVDLRKTNSWRLRLGEIQTSEMLELQLVNAVAPFVLCNKLSQLMKRDNTGQKHIVNVSAMEGKFFRFKKDPRHPHTNMAKAALNMMTHTSAGELAKYGIFMNAVDTGWVTDEDPVELSDFKKEVHDFQPPLDIVDGAARVCDPFFNGILTGSHWCGKFLKDYNPIDW
ncbi:MAG: SDR family NAD(P)-dependent oxidoreductase [Candidatus Anammoxibacter sp.]